MSHTKCVVLTLRSFRKTTQSFVFTIGDEIVAATRKNFMAISLVANIPNQLVIWRIINIMESNSEFYSTQAGTEMSPVNANSINDILTKFIADFVQLIAG